jgi:hypothetical protein
MSETVVQELAGYGVLGLVLAIKEVSDIIRDIGSFAGFAAVVGLAVLSALYFSQARDVRRLREWAGRAPERAAEEEERLQAAARAAATVAGTRAAAATQPATNAGEAASAERAAGARTAAGAAAAGAASGGGEGGGVATAPPRITPRIPSQQTAVLADTLPSSKRPRWYRRIHWPAPRYIALIVAGILVVGGGAAFGVTKLLEDEPASEQAGGTGAGGGGDADSTAPIDPADVKVSVLNGTLVQGLAAQIGDTVKQKGFQLINVANATEQQRAESVVLYTDDANREARAVARRLDISQIEPADDTSRSLAGDATVIVVVGADQTR